MKTAFSNVWIKQKASLSLIKTALVSTGGQNGEKNMGFQTKTY